MKIASVEVMPLSYPTDDRPPRRRYFAILKVTTDDGLVGWGEAGDGFGHSSPLTLQALVAEKLKWILIGQDPMRHDDLIRRVQRDLFRYNGFRELICQAVSAVEIALLDIRGKAEGRSVSELLGRHRDQIEVYASGKPAFDVDADYHVEFNQPLTDRGVKNVKIRVGNNYDWDVAFVHSARDRFADDIRLAVDAKYNYTADSAIRLSHVLGDLGFAWLEEPLPDHNLDEIARVARSSPIPLAYGEHSFTVHDFRELIQHDAAQILQPDAVICGGITEALRVAHLGEAYGRTVIPHCAGMTAIGWAAGVHMAASMPGFTLFEYDSSPVQPLRDEIVADAMFAVDRLRDGCLPVPDGPGLGIDVNEDALREYPHELDENIARSFPMYGTPHI